jgi:hypothetical protein
MSGAKREIERLEELKSAATKIAVKVGLLEECETCGQTFDPMSGNKVDAYKYANAVMTKGGALVKPFESRRELTDTLEKITDEYPEKCECKLAME